MEFAFCLFGLGLEPLDTLNEGHLGGLDGLHHYAHLLVREELSIAQLADRTSKRFLALFVLRLIWIDASLLHALLVVRVATEGAEHHLVLILERVKARWTLFDFLIVAFWYWGLPEKDCLLVIVFEGHPTNLELLALLV